METIEILKKNFEDYAIQHSLALAEGSGKKANRLHKKIRRLYEQVEAMGEVDIFEDFLNSKNDCVKLWAACFCMEKHPDDVKKILKKLTHSPDVSISLDARANLESLNKGKLKPFS